MDFRGEIASALAWWADAGVDMLVDETPRDWLAKTEAPRPVPSTDKRSDELPATIDAFVAWRLADGTLHDPGSPRVPPIGDAASDLAIIVDRPEQGERALLEGSAGTLFDRMLAAIGRDRTVIYAMPLMHAWSAAPPSAENLGRLSDLAMHHLSLSGARKVLIMGDAASRAMLGMGTAEARGHLHFINHKGGTVTAVASYHPRFLLERPVTKRGAWADLQLLMGGGHK